MIKVLHYIPGFFFGGIESLFLSWVAHIDKSQYSFELLSRARDEDSAQLRQYLGMGGVYHHLPPLGLRNAWAFRKAVKMFFAEHHDYDILHIHAGSDPFVLIYAGRYGIRHVIMHSHTAGADPARWQDILKNCAEKVVVPFTVDHAFACSELAAIKRFGGMTWKGRPVRIVRNAIDTDRFAYAPEIRAAKRAELGLSDELAIGHVGRMTPPKNQFFLLECVAALLRRHPASVLLMVGDGPDMAALRDKARSLGIAEAVRFLGARDDVPALMQAMDVFFLPSRYEGLPVTLVEAQACGLPCVISDVVTREVDVSPLILRVPLDAPVEDWLQAFDRAVTMVPDRRDMREAVAKAGFDMRQATMDLCELYEDMVGPCSKSAEIGF